MENPIDYNQLAEGYARFRRVHPHVFGELNSAIQELQAARILEIGCGTGNYLHALQEATGYQAWGLDPSAEMVKRAAGHGGAALYLIARAERLPLRSEYFDLLFSVDVIHHISDRAAYYQEAFRVLKPGGRVCTVTDSEAIIRRREPLAIYFPETIEVEMRRYPPIPWLSDTMRSAGFIELNEKVVETVSQITDIQAFREKAFSSLHLIPAQAYHRGIQKMEEALRRGPIPTVSRYILIWGRKPAGSG